MPESFPLRARSDQNAEFRLLVIGVRYGPDFPQHLVIRPCRDECHFAVVVDLREAGELGTRQFAYRPEESEVKVLLTALGYELLEPVLILRPDWTQQNRFAAY